MEKNFDVDLLKRVEAEGEFQKETQAKLRELEKRNSTGRLRKCARAMSFSGTR